MPHNVLSDGIGRLSAVLKRIMRTAALVHVLLCLLATAVVYIACHANLPAMWHAGQAGHVSMHASASAANVPACLCVLIQISMLWLCDLHDR